jgi:hypothetical protein
MKLSKASYVPNKKRKNNPAGCFFDGKKLVFNTKLDSNKSNSGTRHNPNTTEVEVTGPLETCGDD